MWAQDNKIYLFVLHCIQTPEYISAIQKHENIEQGKYAIMEMKQKECIKNWLTEPGV